MLLEYITINLRTKCTLFCSSAQGTVRELSDRVCQGHTQLYWDRKRLLWPGTELDLWEKDRASEDERHQRKSAGEGARRRPKRHFRGSEETWAVSGSDGEANNDLKPCLQQTHLSSARRESGECAVSHLRCQNRCSSPHPLQKRCRNLLPASTR